MTNILKFPSVSPDMRVGYVSPKDTRRTRREYLDMAKTVLPKKDYQDLLISILDPEHYMKCDKLIRKATDDYYELPERRME